MAYWRYKKSRNWFWFKCNLLSHWFSMEFIMHLELSVCIISLFIHSIQLTKWYMYCSVLLMLLLVLSYNKSIWMKQTNTCILYTQNKRWRIEMESISILWSCHYNTIDHLFVGIDTQPNANNDFGHIYCQDWQDWNRNAHICIHTMGFSSLSISRKNSSKRLSYAIAGQYQPSTSYCMDDIHK